MSDGTLFAAIQLRSTKDREDNRRKAEAWIRRAASHGAGAVALPEMWPFIGKLSDDRAPEDLDGPTIGAMRVLAAELGIWLFPGSFAERTGDTRIHNTAVAIDPSGEIAGVYRKIHLFDCQVPGAAFTESDTVAPGTEATVVDTPFGRVGFAICYDVRFPHLFTDLRAAGAEILLIPSAFTARTGKAHWRLLTRARAVETQCWVVAPEQWGHHNEVRQSHGESVIIDPWGTVVATAAEGEGLALAWVDRARAHEVRERMPVAEHRREYSRPRQRG
jgi:predicted amidohydrolase